LLRTVDIDVHRLVDTILGNTLVYALTDPSDERKEHDERENADSPPLKNLERNSNKTLHDG
jgi:hypothetical protein